MGFQKGHGCYHHNVRYDIRNNFQEIIRLYNEDCLSIHEIAKKFNTSYNTIYNVMRRNGVIFNISNRLKARYKANKYQSWNKGKIYTLKEIWGEERAKEFAEQKRVEMTAWNIKNNGKVSEKARRLSSLRLKDKTYEEIYGKNRAKEVAKKISVANKGKKIPMHQIEFLKKSRLREGNPAWLGGKSFEPYGLDFNKEFKNLVRLRDNFCCIECGISEQKNKILFNNKLSVHHIDFDKQNNCLTNCCSLCSRCHTLTNNGNRNEWIKYYKEKLSNLYGYEYIINLDKLNL